MFGHHRIVGATAAEQAAVDLRMQGLDPAVHDFREAGYLGNIADRDAGRAQRLGRAACGQHFDVQRRKFAGKFNHAGFIGDREQCPADGQTVGRHGFTPEARRGL